MRGKQEEERATIDHFFLLSNCLNLDLSKNRSWTSSRVQRIYSGGEPWDHK